MGKKKHLQAHQWARQIPALPVLHAHPAVTRYSVITEVTLAILMFPQSLFILTSLPADPIAPERPGLPESPFIETSKLISDSNNLREKIIKIN